MFNRLAHDALWLTDPLLLAGAVIVIGVIVTSVGFKHRPIGRFVCQVAFFLLLTLALVHAGVTPDTTTPAAAETTERFLITGYKVIWWLAAAWLLSGFFRAFVTFGRHPRETRFLQDLVAGLIYLGACFGIVAYAFGMPVSGLLATSGAIAIVLGLALQSTLGDLFSGFVLNLAKPFHPGDWINLDSETQGNVIETNWRATHILTPSNDVAIVPNSIIARSKVTNLSRPTKAHGLSILVQVEPTLGPARTCAILEAALLSSNRILHTPRPIVTVKGLNAVSMECELYFYLSDIGAASEAQNELFDLVHRHCATTALRLAPPAGNLLVPLPPASRKAAGDTPERLLDRLPILAPLTENERAALAGKLRRRSFKAGDTLIEPGSVPDALSILSSGVLLATRRDGEQDVELFRLGPGECFGEAGVLTGSPARAKVWALTKGVVYEIAKDDLASILKERPSVASELGQVLARREAVGRERLKRHADHSKHQENLADRLAERMSMLFHLDDRH